jgi:hypothetical protein
LLDFPTDFPSVTPASNKVLHINSQQKKPSKKIDKTEEFQSKKDEKEKKKKRQFPHFMR